MKSLVFPLVLLLVAACGSSSKKGDSKAAAKGGTDSILLSVYEIREQDGGKQVGAIYKRDHRDGRVVFWVDDANGTRRGYITTSNRAYAYTFTMGKRSDTAEFIGEDTRSASARRVLGHDRAVVLVELTPEQWAEKGVRAAGLGDEAPAAKSGDAEEEE